MIIDYLGGAEELKLAALYGLCVLVYCVILCVCEVLGMKNIPGITSAGPAHKKTANLPHCFELTRKTAGSFQSTKR